MKNNPTVSIIINNYNYADFLQTAIDSALNQTYPNIELIVVDDGSTDNSSEIIACYGESIIPILKTNGGQASALNTGFRASHGEIIIFLDADDYLFPDAVEQVVAAWKPDLAKVHYRLQIMDADGNLIGSRPGNDTALPVGNLLPSLLHSGGYITTPTSGNAFSRATLCQILPIPEDQFRISADGYLITLVLFYGEIAAVEKPLGVYRRHGNNLWASSREAVNVQSLQRSLKHDLQKHALIMAKAEEFHHPKPQALGLSDYFHLRHRLASLRLDPQNHPMPGDRSLTLSYWGLRAVWLYTSFQWTKKLVLSLWFIWVGCMPLELTKLAITWLLAPDNRPTVKTQKQQAQRSVQQTTRSF